MIEIKFRWIVKNDKDGKFYSVFSTLKEIERYGHRLLASPSNYDEIIARNLFTGLKDKNGVEIYEEDCLLTDEAGWIAQVFYNRDCFMLIGLDGSGFSCEPNWECCEVIGNVYSNPKLLEK